MAAIPGQEKYGNRFGWVLVLVGQFLAIFAVVALSGPGRIDIVDGQVRYEVARSLVEHGDSVVRDPEVWFNVYPGRDGQRYTYYRLPQIVLGVAAIVLADHTGPTTEARRHFLFTLTGAFTCAVLAVTYSLWFRGQGHSLPAAVGWGSAGIFCTPSWFYGTSTFDDLLGAAALVCAAALAFAARRGNWLWALAAGLALGVAINCKQPLGLFLLPMLAAAYDGRVPLRKQWVRWAFVLAGLAVGLAVYEGYDMYKFPPGSTAGHAAEIEKYAPTWSANPIPALAGLTLSPGTGAIWYWPALVISLVGVVVWYRSQKGFCRAVLAATAGYVLFLSFLTFFAGDPAWGPRYLTPVFALFWVFVPAGAAVMRRRFVVLLLGASFLVQLAALSVDPHRLYVERGLPSAFYVDHPWLYFHPAAAHLVNRPREIAEVLAPAREPARAFSPVPTNRPPTYSFPIIDDIGRQEFGALSATTTMGLLASPLGQGPLLAVATRFPGRDYESGPETVRKYHVLNSLRPWWISQQYLAVEERPVALLPTVGMFVGIGLGGLALLWLGWRNSRASGQLTSSSSATRFFGASLL